MADLIERQAAIDALHEVSEHYTDKGREWHPHVNFMVEAIEALPSAQRTGRWIYNDEAYPGGNPYGHYECDQCGEYVPHKTNYCPNCGCAMKGEDE